MAEPPRKGTPGRRARHAAADRSASNGRAGRRQRGMGRPDLRGSGDKRRGESRASPAARARAAHPFRHRPRATAVPVGRRQPVVGRVAVPRERSGGRPTRRTVRRSSRRARKRRPGPARSAPRSARAGDARGSGRAAAAAGRRSVPTRGRRGGRGRPPARGNKRTSKNTDDRNPTRSGIQYPSPRVPAPRRARAPRPSSADAPSLRKVRRGPATAARTSSTRRKRTRKAPRDQRRRRG